MMELRNDKKLVYYFSSRGDGILKGPLWVDISQVGAGNKNMEMFGLASGEQGASNNHAIERMPSLRM